MKAKASVRRLKGILIKRRDALRRVLREDLAGLQCGVGIDIGDTVDNAVDDTFDLVSAQLAESESRELAQIEDALTRMAKGSYGLCERCEQPIPVARLEVLPYAKHCVKCQRVSEHRESHSSSRLDWSQLRDEVEDEPFNSVADRIIDIS